MSTPAPTNFAFSSDEQGRLVFIAADGVRHEKVRPVRLFPLTEPQHWIAIQDEEGRELAIIEDLHALDEAQQVALQKALAKRDFVPVIHSIDGITRAADGHDWHVTTDRGPTVFRVENDENIQSLGGTRMVIIDHGNTRYLIPNVTTLDVKSRQRLERYY